MKSPRDVSLSLMIVYSASSCAVRRSVKTDGGTSYCVLGTVRFVAVVEEDMMSEGLMVLCSEARGKKAA
jgi:hypothetical protein